MDEGTSIRVRYPEVDRMGVAHHTAHFVWFEIGRTELMRERGVPYGRLEDDEGLLLPVIDASCTYHAPARYDDRIRVRTSVSGVRGVRVTFSVFLPSMRSSRVGPSRKGACTAPTS